MLTVDASPIGVDANLQIDNNQQHPSTGTSTPTRTHSYNSGARGSPEVQETGHDTTEYNDQYTTSTTGHHEIDNGVCGEQRNSRHHNRLQRNENRDNNKSSLLPSATLMAGFTGGVRVISEWIGNCAYNTAHLLANCQGRSVYETTSVFFDRFKKLIYFLTPEPPKLTAKSLLNQRRWRITAFILISSVFYGLYL